MEKEEVQGRAIGGKARIAKMTEAERKAHAMKMVESRRARAVMPKAAYRGVVYIGDIEFPCAVLEDGRRVISENGIHGNLGTSGGKVRQIRSEMEKTLRHQSRFSWHQKPLSLLFIRFSTGGTLSRLNT